MGKLNIKGEFDFDNYIEPKKVDYNVFKRPFFHGTRKYALEISGTERDKFFKICKEVALIAKELYKKGKIEYNTVVYGMGESSSYEYGDFYLTSGFTTAIDFSYQAGGELCQNIYDVCIKIEEKSISITNEIREKIDYIKSEYKKYKNSEKIVLVFLDVEFLDLRYRNGERFVYDEYTKEEIEDLYKCIDSECSCDNNAFRLDNIEKYNAYIVSEKDYRKGFSYFTKIKDIDSYVKMHNSICKTKFDF